MIRHAIIIALREQEAQLQGNLPGLYALDAGDLSEGDEVLFRRAANLDPPGYFASARIKGIDLIREGVVILRFTPLAVFRSVIDPGPQARVLAYARPVGAEEFEEVVRRGGSFDAVPAEAGFAEPEQDFEAPDSGDAKAKGQRKKKAGRRGAPPKSE